MDLIRVLLVEDDCAFSEFVKGSLDIPDLLIEVYVVEDIKEVPIILEEIEPHLVLVNSELCHGNHMSFFRALVSNDSFPTIMFVQEKENSSAEQWIRLGALDYRFKTRLVSKDLPHWVRRWLREWYLLNKGKQTNSLMTGHYKLLELMDGMRSFDEIIEGLQCLFEEHIPPMNASIITIENDSSPNTVFSPAYFPEHWESLNFSGNPSGIKSHDAFLFYENPYFVADITTDPEWKNLICNKPLKDVKAFWSVPIYSGGQQIGVISLTSADSRWPTVPEKRFLDSGSKIAGMAFQFHQIQNRLVSEKNDFLNILDHLPALFFLQTPNGSYPLTNRLYRQKFGESYQPTDPSGPLGHFLKTQSDNQPPKKRIEGTKSYWNSPDGKTYLTIDSPFISQDGSDYIVKMAIDISDQHQSEEKLKRYAQELERSNDDLQDFASITSHDLQEPLRKIITFGQRLLQSKAKWDPNQYYFLDRIQNSTQRMQRFIIDLLEYSKVTTKSYFEPTDLNQVVEEVLSSLSTRVEKTNAQLKLDPLPTLVVDAFQMNQLFQNLLGNALKFNRPGVPPRISVRAENRQNGSWIFTVEDNGIGFNAEDSDKIFRPFERLVNRSEYEGTGIGLAICHKIVNRHGGTIKVESEPGKGTRFDIALFENFQKTSETLSSAPSNQESE